MNNSFDGDRQKLENFKNFVNIYYYKQNFNLGAIYIPQKSYVYTL